MLFLPRRQENYPWQRKNLLLHRRLLHCSAYNTLRPRSYGKTSSFVCRLQEIDLLTSSSFLSPRDHGYTDLAEVTVGSQERLGRWGPLAPLSSSMAADGKSIVTLDLPTTPLAELVNVMDLYQSIFGVTPDVSKRLLSKHQKRECYFITSVFLLLLFYMTM